MSVDATDVTVDLTDLIDTYRNELPQPEQTNYYVSRDAIRHIAYSVDEHSALYLDEEYARGTRWGGIIAPPGYLYSHGHTFHAWPQLLGTIRDSAGLEFDIADNMGDDWEFFLPVRPGDTIISYSRPLEPVVKRGKQLGVFVLTASETRLTNQRGDLVATMKGATARWSGARQSQRGRLAPSYPELTPERHALAYGGRRASKVPLRRYDRHDVYFEDVQEGTVLPEYVVGPLTSAHTRLWEVHAWNTSRSEGGGGIVQGGFVPAFYAAGVMRIPWLGSMLMRWAGPNAWIRKLGFRNKEWVLVGFTYHVRGSVVKKYVEQGHTYVECELRVESELGAVTNTGSAVVELLSRGAR